VKELIYNKIFSLVSGIVSVYFTLEAVNDYLEYETVSKIEYIYHEPLQYPAFTICSENGRNASYFDFEKLKELIRLCEIIFDKDCDKNDLNFKDMSIPENKIKSEKIE